MVTDSQDDLAIGADGGKMRTWKYLVKIDLEESSHLCLRVLVHELPPEQVEWIVHSSHIALGA